MQYDVKKYATLENRSKIYDIINTSYSPSRTIIESKCSERNYNSLMSAEDSKVFFWSFNDLGINRYIYFFFLKLMSYRNDLMKIN